MQPIPFTATQRRMTKLKGLMTEYNEIGIPIKLKYKDESVRGTFIPSQTDSKGLGPRMSLKEYAESRYHEILKGIEDDLGNKALSAKEIDDYAKPRLGYRWGGVRDYSSTIPKRKRRNMWIKNTADSPGEHWVALIKTPNRTVAYDSFGRGVIVGNEVAEVPEQDSEQKLDEENCGQRCLAWLLLVHQIGTGPAMHI